VEVFGKQLTSGEFSPSHFFNVNGYLIKDWLKGDIDHSWLERPIFKESFYMFKDKGVLRLSERSIRDIPSILNIPDDVLWMGTIFVAEAIGTLAKSNEIKL